MAVSRREEGAETILQFAGDDKAMTSREQRTLRAPPAVRTLQLDHLQRPTKDCAPPEDSSAAGLSAGHTQRSPRYRGRSRHPAAVWQRDCDSIVSVEPEWVDSHRPLVDDLNQIGRCRRSAIGVEENGSHRIFVRQIRNQSPKRPRSTGQEYPLSSGDREMVCGRSVNVDRRRSA
jgi:hypothetical protein